MGHPERGRRRVIEPFTLGLPGQVRFGAGVSSEIAERCAAHGSTALVVTGSSPQRHQAVLDQLRQVLDNISVMSTTGEPTTTVCDDTTAQARALADGAGADVVVSIGGGSVIDLGKAVAMLLGNGGAALDYLEVVGAGHPIQRPSVPHVAVPTTSGAGSEVTANAVLAASGHGLKASLRSPLMIPTVALVDPELTRGAPPAVVAASGIDALTQCVEPFVSRFANPVTDAWAAAGIRRAAGSLRRAVLDGDDDARADMALCALLGGLSLANAKLGAVHGLAGPLGGMIDVPHGAACAALLAPVLEANIAAVRRADADLGRFREVARLLTGSPDAEASDAVDWVRQTVAAVGVSGLSAYGMTSEQVPEAAAKGARASSMRGNPVTLSEEELQAVLTAAL
jgi:alcohol dehydrogenase class IV